MFCFDFNTIPLIPLLLQSLRVSNPIVGKSTLRSWLFLGNLINIPCEFFDYFINCNIFFVPLDVSWAIMLVFLITNAWT